MALLKRKPKFTYEITQRQNFLGHRVFDAGDVINAVIAENDRLIDEHGAGSALIMKFNKRGEVIVAQRIALPKPAKTNFDELLGDFYSKRLVDFDEAILEEPVVEEVPSVTPEMPAELAQLAQQGQQIQAQVAAPQQQPAGPSEDFLALKAMFEAQQKTLVALQDQLQQQTQEPEKAEEAAVPSEDESTALAQAPTESESQAHQPTTIALPDSGGHLSEATQTFKTLPPVINHDPKTRTGAIDWTQDDADKERIKGNQVDPAVANAVALGKQPATIEDDLQVSEMLVGMKQAIADKLTRFVSEEQAKIDEEIKALDKRGEIEQTVTTIYADQKQQQLVQAKATITHQKQAAVAAENRRHEQALSDIETDHQVRFAEQVQSIQGQFEALVKEKIAAEYERQTEQLNHILQGKTDELQLRQRALNTGLKANFEKALQAFNTDHEQVIKTVEQQRAAKIIPMQRQQA
jgi:Tfp pilus assembly protein PilP